jgi:hypothetical protein
LRTERRRSQRKLVVLNSFVASEAAGWFGNPQPARTRNLSISGALIDSSERLFEGEICRFDVVTADGHRGEIEGRIVWANAESNGSWRAGIAFRNLSPDEQYLLDLQLVKSSQNAP